MNELFTILFLEGFYDQRKSVPHPPQSFVSVDNMVRGLKMWNAIKRWWKGKNAVPPRR